MDFDAHSDPFQAFNSWMAEAKAHSAIREPTAMSFASVNAAGEAHARIVLCKDWSAPAFTFFTNYQSQKGQDVAANRNAATVFYWDPLFRQVKISGTITQTNRQVSIDYWNSRPRESRLSQYISRQSETLDSRERLEDAWKAADLKFKNSEIPCPEHWGGYLLYPRSIEFWQGLPNRLHDRFLYERTGESPPEKNRHPWTFRRLYP